MRFVSNWTLPVLAAALLAGCGASDTARDTASTDAAPAAPSAPPYKPVASTLDLMRSIITFSAETYWESVSVIVDADGITEHQPETEEDWIEVWAAGMSLAEAGNLLMMPPRAVDDPEWVRLSTELVDVGFEAAQIASARDFEGVLDYGERIYNVCVDCHQEFVPALPDL